MSDDFSRVTAFLAVVLALLCAGFQFHNGHVMSTLYFMVGAILVTAFTHLNVRKGLI
ncbi:hypothetical protein LB542_16000 [Mesorhizobium sp. BR1-1-9]|uniref:hypothetical protein n=1 Tax=unclassified Mesorhizobium TaxID=325217 RepID=UPI0015E477FF|nr:MULTISPECIES: hypothetical protein [unclassified Mesorhizobium]MBZ9811119.1 hypothetical protein [Mesorhizobium sp. ESP-6-2]MBZ9872353.1 hypothetical protein [Mesorhizobium sp. BR1-1-9]MBZ9944693.1 hypothetical protein [Mesorhizobium sp. BR1-1-13]